MPDRDPDFPAMQPEKRSQLLSWFSMLVIALTAVNLAGYLPVYIHTRNWQVLAFLALSATAMIVAGIAWRTARQGKFRLAAVLLGLLLAGIPFWGWLVAGRGFYLLAAGTAGILTLSALLWPRRQVVWLASTMCFIAYAWVVTRLSPVSRLALPDTWSSRLPDLLNIAVLLSLLVGFAVHTIRAGTIQARLLVSYILVVCVPLFLAGTFNLTPEIGRWLALCFLLLAAAAALLLAHSITMPLKELTGISEQFDGSHLDLSFDIQREDEIGELAQALKHMIDRTFSLVRAHELSMEERTYQLEQRFAKLQLAAEVAHAISIQTDLEMLVHEGVELIRDRFGLYHAGIYLLDNTEKFAILCASSGFARKKLPSNEHRHKIGTSSTLGMVISTGEARIAPGVESCLAEEQNPLLPEPRSEMVLPLHTDQRVIGALIVQSIKAEAFSQEDIAILQVVADQLAVAIENARLIQNLNSTVQELERAYGRDTQEAWYRFTQSSRHSFSLRYQHLEVEPAEEQHPEAGEALQKGQTIITRQDGACALAVPIRLRSQVIGVVNLRFEGESLAEEMVSLVEEVTARLSLVVENARLLQEAQRQAQREQQINQIASAVSASSHMESVLQNTVRELGKALGASRAFIHITDEFAPARLAPISPETYSSGEGD